MKQIDLAIPENAKNVTVTVTYQLDDNNELIKSTVSGTLNTETVGRCDTAPVINVPYKDLSTSQRVLLAMRNHPNATVDEIAVIANIGKSTVRTIQNILRYGLPELKEMLRNNETNATYIYKFMVGFPIYKQKELIAVHGIKAVKEYARSLSRKRNTIYRNSRNTVVNVF